MIAVIAGLVFVGVVVVSIGYLGDRGWVRIGATADLARARVVYVTNLHLFVVTNGSHPVAVADRSPRAASRVLFCPTSGYFEDRSGSTFDRFGVFVSGPASASLARIGIRIRNASVDVNPDQRSPGPAVGSATPARPWGAACDPSAPEGPQGFLQT
ncbi:MAG TPA: hypothetical protein VGH10_13475 [Actinomycetota bacterium]